MFNCTAIASFITWEIDGVLINNYIRDKGFDNSAPTLTFNLTQELRGTSLRVLGSPNSNNVSITCVAIIPITLMTNDIATSELALHDAVQGSLCKLPIFWCMFRVCTSSCIHLVQNHNT